MTHILTLLQENNSEQKQALVKILGLKETDDHEISSKISKILWTAKGGRKDVYFSPDRKYVVAFFR